jgi:hypothetical protein
MVVEQGEPYPAVVLALDSSCYAFSTMTHTLHNPSPENTRLVRQSLLSVGVEHAFFSFSSFSASRSRIRYCSLLA